MTNNFHKQHLNEQLSQQVNKVQFNHKKGISDFNIVYTVTFLLYYAGVTPMALMVGETTENREQQLGRKRGYLSFD